MSRPDLTDDYERIRTEVLELMTEHMVAGVHPRIIVNAVQDSVTQGLIQVDEDFDNGMRTTTIYRPLRRAV